jgi:hypothetical protein
MLCEICAHLWIIHATDTPNSEGFREQIAAITAMMNYCS